MTQRYRADTPKSHHGRIKIKETKSYYDIFRVNKQIRRTVELVVAKGILRGKSSKSNPKSCLGCLTDTPNYNRKLSDELA